VGAGTPQLRLQWCSPANEHCMTAILANDFFPICADNYQQL